MDQIPHFIDRKFGREKVEYLDQRMEPILRETYGIMVYQEQVMLVARAIGGYSWAALTFCAVPWVRKTWRK